MGNTKNLFIIVIIMAFIGGIYLIYQKAEPAYRTYKEVQERTVELESLKKQVDELKVKKEAYEKAEKVKTKPVYKNDLYSNDQMSSFGVMFEDVIQSAKYNGLKLRSIEYNMMPQDDIVVKNLGSEFNVCAIQMQIIGSYMQLRSYFQDIYNYPYMINLDKISITPYDGNKKILIADVAVVIYSEMSDEQKKIQRVAESLKKG